MITSLIHPHCTTGRCPSLAEETWRRAQAEVSSLCSETCDGDSEGKSSHEHSSGFKGRINESLVTKGVHAMRRNHIPQEPDWTYPSSLNESFSEFHPISSVWNFSSGFGETWIKGHDFRWCITHWVDENTHLWTQYWAGMEVNSSKSFFLIWRPPSPLFVFPHQWLVNNKRRD